MITAAWLLMLVVGLSSNKDLLFYVVLASWLIQGTIIAIKLYKQARNEHIVIQIGIVTMTTTISALGGSLWMTYATYPEPPLLVAAILCDIAVTFVLLFLRFGRKPTPSE